MDKKFIYGIGKNPETGFVEIRPMNEENAIIIHGTEEAIFFIHNLLDCFQKE